MEIRGIYADKAFFPPSPINAANHLQHLHIGQNHGISLEFADDADKAGRIHSFSGSGEKENEVIAVFGFWMVSTHPPCASHPFCCFNSVFRCGGSR